MYLLLCLVRFFFFFCPVVYFLFKLDLEAFFASGKDFFFFSCLLAHPYSNQTLRHSLPQGRVSTAEYRDRSQVLAFEFENLFESSRHRQ